MHIFIKCDGNIVSGSEPGGDLGILTTMSGIWAKDGNLIDWYTSHAEIYIGNQPMICLHYGGGAVIVEQEMWFSDIDLTKLS